MKCLQAFEQWSRAFAKSFSKRVGRLDGMHCHLCANIACAWLPLPISPRAGGVTSLVLASDTASGVVSGGAGWTPELQGGFELSNQGITIALSVCPLAEIGASYSAPFALYVAVVPPWHLLSLQHRFSIAGLVASLVCQLGYPGCHLPYLASPFLFVFHCCYLSCW